MKNYSYAAFAVVFALLATSRPAFAEQTTDSVRQAVEYLTDGVDEVPLTGQPGPVATTGDNAFSVVLGSYANQTLAPVVAAAFVEKGRVVAFGHTDYCKPRAINQSESMKRLIVNSIKWASGKTQDEGTRVAVWREPSIAERLKELGFDAFDATSVDDACDVWVADACAFSDEEYEKIFQAIQNGAGFLATGLGWGWSQLNPQKNLVVDHGGNRNFAKYGVNLAWPQGTLAKTGAVGYIADSHVVFNAKYVDGRDALAFFDSLAQDRARADETLAKASSDELRQLRATESLIFPYLSQEGATKLDAFVNSFSADLVPTEANPIRGDALVARLAVEIQSNRFLTGQALNSTDASIVPAFAAAESFPGSVPDDAERLNDVVVKIKTAVPDWHSTGLYAAPGETITISVAPEIFAAFPKPFKVRIGAHRDRLWHLDEWKRWPEICVEKTLTSPTTTIANPFGGLVYVVAPNDVGSAGLGLVDFSISGAVAAPYFVRDETSLTDWKTIRKAPAPWAEIQGRNIVLTVPSSVVRALDDPQALATIWDEILDLEAQFASKPLLRKRPERICCDRQISAGYMHSGYPVMTWMDVEEQIVDADRLRNEGNWGFYHEFGHNHQSPYWTFDGTVEVTCNYFTLYVMEKLNGRSAGDARGELKKESRLKLLKRYLSKGAKFEDWARDPFLALNMTVQLRDEFGWEPFLRAVNEYEKAAPEQLPKNDQEKRDQWMIRLSRNTGKNLAPFFNKWGVRVSESASKSVEDLPTWISEEFDELGE